MKPILTLFALTIVMPELVTGSTPLYGFLNLVNLIVLFFGYGITILLIREFFVRYNLNFLGLFLLGLAYVNINEGLIAKTMILESGIPWPIFDHYGYIAGISVPWSVVMGVWHAVYSVMFPILATHFLFPGVSKESWISKKLSFLLVFPVLLLGVGAFLGEHRGVGTIEQFVLIVGNMLLLIFLAMRFGKKQHDTDSVQQPVPTKKLLWLGLSTFFFWTILVCIVLVGIKVPLIILFAVIVLGIMWYVRRLKKIGITNDTLLYFILGGYLQTAITGILIALFFNPALLSERLPAEIIILVIIAILVRKVSKRYAVQTVQ